jgi:hypothetical protein
VRRGLTTVANKLESPNDLTNGEKAEHLSRNNTASGELSRADIPHLLDDVLRRLDDGTVLDGLDNALVCVLEGGQVAARCKLVDAPPFEGTCVEELTEGSSSGCGRRTCQARGRPWSSKRRRELVL